MSDPVEFSKGFASVDRMPDPALLVRAMDETADWQAVRELRAHTADRLRIGPGGSLLDVGCGPGDVVITLARTIGPGGRAVGIDVSSTMLDEARRRALAAGVTAEFEVGDAMALAFPDDTFDAARSERTFQWLPDASGALAEMVRVTRPGGAVVVIDTDWGSFTIDHPEPAVTRKIFDHFENSRTEHTVGRRLGRLFRAAGLDDVTVEARAAVITEWDPDTRPGPPGMPPLAMFIASIVESGGITADEGESWIDNITRLGRAGDFCAALTIYAACGTKPSPA